MNPVIHFEMPIDNGDRVVEFYSKIFGWQMQKLGQDMGNYILAMTIESDEKGPIKPGGINGGFYPRMADAPDQCPSVVISVENIREYMKKIEAAGGDIMGEPMEIPNIGWYVSFHDPEGNRVSLLEPSNT